MSLFSRWFKKREKIGLRFESLDSWLSDKTKAIIDQSYDRVSDAKKKIDAEIGKAKENIEALENAKLRNDKITVRERQLMQGNLDFYAKRFNSFLGSINIPDDDLDSFADDTKQKIHDFGKSTHKAYQILQHFFSDETYHCAQNLKKIDSLMKILKDIINDKKVKDIKRTNKQLARIKSDIKKEKALIAEQKSFHAKMMGLLEDKKNITTNLNKKETSPEFRNFSKLEVDEYKIKEHINDIGDELSGLLSALEHSIKKHLRLHPEDEKLVTDYFENPLVALVKDKELHILKVMDKLKNNIHTNKLDLKDKKKDKTITVIGRIDRTFLKSHLDQYIRLKHEKSVVKEEYSKFTITKDIDEIKKKLEKKNNEISEHEKDIQRLKADIENINISKSKNHLKEQINELLNVDLEID